MTLPETASARPRRRRNRLKTFAVLVLVCLAIVVVVRMIGPQTVGEQARRVFEKQLADHYTDWHVSVGRGIYRSGVGLQFEDISLSPRVPTKRNHQAEPQSSVAGRTASITDAILATWNQQPAVEIQRLTVFADIDAIKLLDKQNPLITRRVLIEGVTTDMRLQGDGTLSLAGLWPPPQLGPICPEIELKGVTLNLSIDAKDGSRSQQDAEEERPLQFRWSQILVENTCEIAAVRDGVRRLTIRGDSDVCKTCDLTLTQTLRAGDVQQTSVMTRIAGLKINNTLVQRVASWLPQEPPSGAQFSVLGDLNLRFDKGVLSKSVSGVQTGKRIEALDYELDYIVHDGRYADKRLPDELESLRGRVRLTPSKIELFPTAAKLGAAVVNVEGSSDLKVALSAPVKPTSAYATIAPPRADAISIPLGDARLLAQVWNTNVAIAATDFRVDRGLRQLLPARSVIFFDRFEPDGRIDVGARLSNAAPLNGAPWSIGAKVQCKGVDVQFDRFPYPVEQLTGLIEIAEGRVDAQRLTGIVGGRPIHCIFNVPLKLRPDEIVSPQKTIVIQSDGAIPIDNALVSALTPRVVEGDEDADVMERENGISKLESFVRSLHPRGAIELASATIDTDANGVTNRRFDLRVIGGTLRYEKFAYPLYNVAGRIQVENDLVRIMGFTASNAGAAKIACDGLYQMPQPSTQTPSDLNLGFRIADIAMDHSLRVSLPESSRSIWDSLSPAGTLDQLYVHVQQTGADPIVLTLNAAHQTESRANPNSLSIRPKSIPYRIDVVGGNVQFKDNVVTIENLRGRHDASRLIADGRCWPDPSGQWILQMDLHSGCRVIPDEELIAALPEQMRWAMRGLDLRGPLGLRGETLVFLPQNENAAPAITWDLAVQLEGNRIADVGPVHSLRGEIMIRGIKDGDLLRAGGDVAIDSLHAYGLQATSVRGPFSIIGDELRLGTLSSETDPITNEPRTRSNDKVDKAGRTNQSPILGQMFDGQLDVSGTVKLSSGDFDVGATMTNAQIATILAEVGQMRSGVTGRFDMNSRLDGRLGDSDLLKGAGTARISGANMYELPMLVQVLNLLRITPTEDVAFTDGESEFSIFGEDVNFNRLSMWGDLVALDGSGTLSRLEHLDLTFNTKVSPTNLFSKVISPMRDNRYTFFTIEVDGPLSAPTIQRHALSGVSQTLESWFPGMIRSTTANTTTVR